MCDKLGFPSSETVRDAKIPDDASLPADFRPSLRQPDTAKPISGELFDMRASLSNRVKNPPQNS